MSAGGGGDSPYKVVEIADVGEREIENALNEWTAGGYRFESIHFVTQPGSRRPAMAFLVFNRRADDPADGAAPGAPSGGYRG